MMNNFKDEDFDNKIKNEEISVVQFSLLVYALQKFNSNNEQIFR